MRFDTIWGGPLIDIDPDENEITEDNIHCLKCWESGKRPIMGEKSTDPKIPYGDKFYTECPLCYHILHVDDVDRLSLKKKCRVIPFPTGDFTGEPIKLTEEQKKKIIKKFNSDRKKINGFTLSWNNLFH
jgi:hypothetical protein